jgi:hypothetical protein
MEDPCEKALSHCHHGIKTMKAIGVAKYGAVDNFESRDVPRPESPT